jgi:hypothetical protein
MKSFLNNSYDKLFFLSTILILIFISCYSFLISDEIDNITSASYDVKDNWTRSPDGYCYESDVSMSLMPGDKISFLENRNNDRNFTQVKIVRIDFKRRSSLVVYLKDGTEFEGTVKAKEGVTFNINWRKSNQPILIDDGNKIRSIPSRDIVRVLGKPKYFLEKDADIRKLIKSPISFFQHNQRKSYTESTPKPTEWRQLNRDSNESIYDLFTPPLIYIIDGKLTTTLPEAEVEEEKEKFGATLLSFEKKPYRFRLSSWIGNNPYLEDTYLSEKFGIPVRKRLEVNKSYKLLQSPKRGQSSLIAVDSNSSDKLITLKYFAVQQVTQKTGGVRPVGRALLIDHSVKEEPFELNSIMKEIDLGQFEVTLSLELDDKEKLSVSLNEKDDGREIEYYGRKYKILKWDTSRKSLFISKQIGLSPEIEEVELFAP